MAQLKCIKPECQFSKTGICHEGNAPSDGCPFIIKESEEPTEPGALSGEPEEPVDSHAAAIEVQEYHETVSEASASLVSKLQHLPICSGLELAREQAEVLTRERRTMIIVLLGTLDCGKTTLVAEIFENLRESPIRGLLFSGSATLVAFDRRCYKARVDSGNTTPHTDRTPQAALGSPYLHLDLCRKAGLMSESHRLLIADISGESYEAASHSTEECSTLDFVRRSDYIVLMFDGARLTDPTQRETVKSTMIRLLQRLVEAGQTKITQRLQVAITKWDLIEQDKVNGSAEFVKGVEDAVGIRFENHFSLIATHHLAARPLTSDGFRRLGIEDLVEEWCPALETATPSLLESDGIEPLRQISAYKAVTGTEL